MFNQFEIDYEQILPKYGYLYEFELQKDLLLLFTDDNLTTDDYSDPYCHMSIPCLQPIEILIFGKYDENICMFDEGSELIIPYNFITKYLKFIGAMKVDLKSLFSIDCDLEKYKNYDPYESILGPISVKNPLK